MKWYHEALAILIVAAFIGFAMWAVGWLHESPSPAPAPAPSGSAVALFEREHDQWMVRRKSEFTRCAEARGTPAMGYNGSVVCLNSGVVHFVGEPAPTYPESKR